MVLREFVMLIFQSIRIRVDFILWSHAEGAIRPLILSDKERPLRRVGLSWKTPLGSHGSYRGSRGRLLAHTLIRGFPVLS